MKESKKLRNQEEVLRTFRCENRRLGLVDVCKTSASAQMKRLSRVNRASEWIFEYDNSIESRKWRAAELFRVSFKVRSISRVKNFQLPHFSSHSRLQPRTKSNESMKNCYVSGAGSREKPHSRKALERVQSLMVHYRHLATRRYRKIFAFRQHTSSRASEFTGHTQINNFRWNL